MIMPMKSLERSKAIELRMRYQLGYGDIAKRLKVSKSTLGRWLQDLPLSESRILELRRQAWNRGEVKRERFRATMRKKRESHEKVVYLKQKKELGALSSQTLFVAGLMLYVAEGDKKDRYHIGLANTDPRIIEFFIWWLQKYLKIRRSQVRVQLHLYEQMNIGAEKRFWRKITGIHTRQFYKDQIRPLRPSSFSYAESFRHGTCKIYVQGGKYKTNLMLSIQAFFDTYRGLRS